MHDIYTNFHRLVGLINREATKLYKEVGSACLCKCSACVYKYQLYGNNVVPSHVSLALPY